MCIIAYIASTYEYKYLQFVVMATIACSAVDLATLVLLEADSTHVQGQVDDQVACHVGTGS